MQPAKHMHSAGDKGAQEQVPIIDQQIMSDWCSDLSRSEILSILARMPDESHRCILEIEKAVVDRSLTEAKRVAHRLKGMAANLGAARLAQIARGIELGSERTEDVARKMPELQQALRATLAELHSFTES